ncbi:hypothetical protein BV22DRAFT_1037488 [Leucogyrophana mollusca]|uniref:Uncharacterized protein n=1 Tax=Leucogyrophana mollusca TaxID=85980 RepID=A0ACB8B9D1_9AGAM|nr:hypothetical protein BV22DRAFT_1037488 [Leucogyrophana mollusca]
METALPTDTATDPPLIYHQPHSHPSDSHSFNSNASNRDFRTPRSHRSSTYLRDKRKSQAGDLGLLEAQLLPSLRDTIDRMTRPPSRSDLYAQSSLPFHDGHPATVGRSPSCSSSSTAASDTVPYTSRSSSLTRPTYHSPATPQSGDGRSFSRSTPKAQPKPILKSQLRTPTLSVSTNRTEPVEVASPPPNRSLRTGRIVPKFTSNTPTQPLVTRSRGGKQGPSAGDDRLQSKLPVAHSADSPRYPGRARSRTDPGIIPQNLTSARNVTAPLPQDCSSSIPRRTGTPLMFTSAYHAQKTTVEGTGSDSESRFEAETRDRRKLFVANAVIVPSSSSGSENELRTPVTKSMLPIPCVRNTSSQGTVEKKPARFGLGFGFGDYGTRFKGIFADTANSLSIGGSQSDEVADSKRANEYSCTDALQGKDSRDSVAPGDDQGGLDKYYSAHRPRGEDADRRRQEELLGLVDSLNERERQSQQYKEDADDGDICGPEGFLAISGSGEYIAFPSPDRGSRASSHADDSDSNSEYSIDDEEQEAIHSCTPKKSQPDYAQGFASALVASTGKTESRRDLYSPRDPTTPKCTARVRNASMLESSHGRHQRHLSSEYSSSSGDEASGDTTQSVDAPRYSLELSRLMATSTAAAAREGQAFGLPASLSGCGTETPQDGELTHAESDMSSFAGDRWQADYEEFAVNTNSLLKQLASDPDNNDPLYNLSDSDQTSDDDQNLGSCDQPSMNDEMSYASSQSSTSRSSMSSSAEDFMRPSWRGAASGHDGHSPENSDAWEVFCESIVTRYGEAEIHRQRVIWELTDTEVTFVAQLQNMVRIFIRPLRVRNSKAWITGVPPDVARLLDWLEDIVHLHSQLSSSLISRRQSHDAALELVGESLRPFVPKLEIYQPYLVKLEFVAAMIEQLVNDGKSDFGEFVRLQEGSQECSGWSLEKYLVEPVNRLAQYPDFFRRLFQATPKQHTDYVASFSLLHSSKLVIRVLSEVKDREDEYELIKDICASIQNLHSTQLAKRERRLLFQGPLICSRMEDIKTAPSLPTGLGSPSTRGAQRPAENDSTRNARLSKALKGWSGRSPSVRSTSSTAASLKSFRTAPSSFDFHIEPPVLQNICASPPASLAPVNVQAFVFTDLLVLATPVAQPHSLKTRKRDYDGSPIKWRMLDDFGIARIISVCDSTDSPPQLCLDLIPLTLEELEKGVVDTKATTVSVTLSPHKDNSLVGASMPATLMSKGMSAFRQSCQYTLKSLSCPKSPTSYLVHACHSHPDSEDRRPVLSILASGLPFPKSPSIQLEEADHGQTYDAKQQEREERGWWSLRFHQVFGEVHKQDIPHYS